jgi:voltage-gated potassium channel
MTLAKRLTIVLGIFFGVFAASTAALMGIEGWSFLDAVYMTTITLFSVGYGEVNPLTSTGRWLMIGVIFAGAGALAVTMSMITAFIVEGELRDVLGKRRMEKMLLKLHDHIIVCGAGETGIHVVEEMAKTKTPCVVIEQNLPQLRHRERLGAAPVVEGDATDEGVLKRARIETARGLVTTMPSDKDNLFVILTARGLNPRLRIVSRGVQDESQDKLRRAGADAVVSANRIGGLRMASEMIRPNVVSFLDTMLRDTSHALRLEEALIPEGSPLCGRTLGAVDLHNRVGLVIIAVRHGGGAGHTYNPKADYALLANDSLIVCGELSQVEMLRQVVATG